jgi:hypothetical protein
MRNQVLRWLVLTALATAFLAAPSAVPAADPDTQPPAAAPQQPKANRPYPFNGRISAVDKINKTITVGQTEKKRVFQITSETRMVKAGKPAILDDAVVGEEVGGLYRKTDDGKLEAVSLRFGPKPESAASRPKPKSKSPKGDGQAEKH